MKSEVRARPVLPVTTWTGVSDARVEEHKAMATFCEWC